MIKYICYCFLVFLIFSISCKKNKCSSEDNDIDAGLQQIDVQSVSIEDQDGYDRINNLLQHADSVWIIVPIIGCDGCMKTSLDFCSKNHFKYKTKIVLTSFESLKILKMKIPDSLINRAYVDLDKDNAYHYIIRDNPNLPHLLIINCDQSRIKAALSAHNISSVFKLLKN